MSLRIFLSHAWADKTYAAYKLISNHLAEKGYEVWLDQSEMQPGDMSITAMKEGVQWSEVVVALVSPQYESSENCMLEFNTAKENKKAIIACQVGEKRPSGALKGIITIDFSPGNTSMIDGFATLDHFLIRYQALRSGDAQLTDQSKKIGKLWTELTDHAVRKQKGASGNEASSVYLSSSISALQELLAADLTPENQKLSALFESIETHVNKVYTQPWQDAVKSALTLALVEQHDPQGTDERLNLFRQLLSAGSDPAVTRIALCIERARTHPHNAKAPENFVRALFFVPDLLNKVAVAGKQLGLQEELRTIFDTIAAYYEKPDDLVPDNLGYYGLADDTFLALTYLYELDKLCQQQLNAKLFDISLDEQANALRQVLQPNQVDVLRAHVLQQIRQAAEAKQMQQFAGAFLAGLFFYAMQQEETASSFNPGAGQERTLESVRQEHAQNQSEWAYLHLKGQL